MFLEEPLNVFKQVTKIQEILPRSWTNYFVNGDETREPDVVVVYALFKNLQAHDMHIKKEEHIVKGEDRRTDLIVDIYQKRDAKTDELLASKVSESENPEIDDNMDYITQRFQNIMSECGGFMKKENHDSPTISSKVCYKCDQPGHPIRDCPMHKA